jgi:hypothetical protein
VGVEHLAVTEDPVDGVEGHRSVEMLWQHRVGRLGPIHHAALEHAGFPPLLGKERVGVTEEVERLVGRDILHWAFHR